MSDDLLTITDPRRRPWQIELDRRAWLKSAAALLAGAALPGCRDPETPEALLATPDGTPPGEWTEYNTTLLDGGYGCGVLARCRGGRPIKVEGNPLHPASRGAADARWQAAVLDLYDPDRAGGVRGRAGAIDWPTFDARLRAALAPLIRRRGAGLHLLVEPTTSPTLRAHLDALATALPHLRLHVWSPWSRAAGHAGLTQLFGRPLEWRHHLDAADAIVCLDADPLGDGPDRVRHAHALGPRRVPGAMTRLYVAESSYTITGALADHRTPIRPSAVRDLARALVRALRGGPPPDDPWLRAAAADLRARRGLVIAGAGQPPAVHALAHAANHLIGAIGRAVVYTDPIATPLTGVDPLVEAIDRGDVAALVVIGGDPVYSAPETLGDRFGRVPLTVHHARLPGATGAAADWFVPALHPFEAWGDARATDGTASLMQPLIAPIHGGVSTHRLLSTLADEVAVDDRVRVERTWRDTFTDPVARHAALRDGVIAGTAAPPVDVTPDLRLIDRLALPSDAPPVVGFELVFRPDPALGAGEGANNPWLLELPRPLTRLTWDNAALISPATARILQVEPGDHLRIGHGDNRVEGPAWIVPGLPDEVVTLHLGWGRPAGRMARGAGFSVAPLRPGDAGFALDALVSPASGHTALACVQPHREQHGRDLARAVEASDATHAIDATHDTH
ncbi:MAG: molybdopterin oxidoreductase, partial [Myxococcales bacterium]|nr:molybdopterin oxidoreductase [Myxococcales bacterium]